jgi:hypothetical protein
MWRTMPFKLVLTDVQFLLTEGDMGQDPGDEVFAAEGVFHFEQVAPGLSHSLHRCTVPSILFGSS